MEGSCTLKERYVFQNGQLVNVSNSFASTAVSSFSASGKYLVFVSTKGLDALANSFGAPFINALGDVCKTEKLDQPAAGEEYVFLDEMSAEVPIFYDMVNTPWILTLTILAIVLPLIGLIYWGIKMIFGFKTPKWRPGLVLFVLWLVILVVLAVLFALGVVSTEYLSV